MGYIVYDTRSYNNDTVKISSGSFGGNIDWSTINRLVNSQFEVMVKNSGSCVFVDKSGREVCLYLAIDASKTDKGKISLKEFYKEKERMADLERMENDRIKDLLDSMTNEEILARLS